MRYTVDCYGERHINVMYYDVKKFRGYLKRKAREGYYLIRDSNGEQSVYAILIGEGYIDVAITKDNKLVI